jgi:hypothetical protein
MPVRTAFQRRHYQAVADLLKDVQSANPHEDIFIATLVLELVDRFADMFAADNPRFSRSRFVDAAHGK